MLIWSLPDKESMRVENLSLPFSEKELLPPGEEKEKFNTERYLRVYKKASRWPLAGAKQFINALASWVKEDTLDWWIAFLNNCDIYVISDGTWSFTRITHLIKDRKGEPIKNPVLLDKFHEFFKNTFPTPLEEYTEEDQKAAQAYADEHVPQLEMLPSTKKECALEDEDFFKTMFGLSKDLELNIKQRHLRIDEYLSKCTPLLSYYRQYCDKKDGGTHLAIVRILINQWEKEGQAANNSEEAINDSKEFIDGVTADFEETGLPAYAVERTKAGRITVVKRNNVRGYVHHDFSDLTLEKL